MLVVTHAVTGAVIGQLVKNSPLSFILGVVVHFLMDMIPHGDSAEYKKFKESNKIPKGQIYQLIFDNVIMFGLVIYLLVFKVDGYWWPTFWGIIGSILPDLAVGIHESRPNRFSKPLHRLHFMFHDIIVNRWKDVRLRYSIILQLIALAIVISQFI